MLTPAEELGLSGLSLASRVRKAFYKIPEPQLLQVMQRMREEALRRHLCYLRDGQQDIVPVFACPMTVLPDQVSYIHYVTLTIQNALKRLPDQDRTRWDASAIAEGTALVSEALRDGSPGKYALLAAINALHDEAPTWEDTDWPQIVGLYDHLVGIWPTPVVALNRAVAIRFAAGPAAGLAELDELADDPRLAVYPYLAAARADCLRELGRGAEARPLYEEAILLTGNDVERAFLAEQLQQLSG